MVEGGYLTLTYSRIKPPSTVLYAIEVADAPGAFRAPNPGEINEVILFDTGITQTVKAVDTVSSASQPNRFPPPQGRPGAIGASGESGKIGATGDHCLRRHP
jgi:hypothetical protein